MNDHESLIPRNILGIFLLCGITVLLGLHIGLMWSIATTCGALAILLITGLFLYRPLYGFLAIIILRTSVDYRASSFSLTITENVQLNIASVFALQLIVTSIILLFFYRKKFFRIPLLIPFALFIVFTAGTYFYSIDKAATFQETLRILSIFMSFSSAYMLCINIPHARKTIIAAILLASAIPLSIAFLQLVGGTGFSDNTGTDGRLFGTFKHPNSFASFLLIVISILTYRVFSGTNTQINKTASRTLLFITISLLLLTFSRGGWFAIIIFFGIFSLLRTPKVLLIIVAFTATLFFTSQTIHDRIEDIYNPPADSSIRWRVQQWKNALAAWQLSPALGYGAGTEIAIHEQEQGFYAGNPYTHNDFIKALQETGVIGLAFFAFLMFSTGTYLIKKYRQTSTEEEKMFILVITLLFIAEIGFGMSSNIWRGTAVQWLLWTLIACALSIESRKKNIH